MNRAAAVALHAVPAALLLGALAPWPDIYFTILRIVVCVAAIWLAVLEYQRFYIVGPWAILLIVCAVLINPIAPIALTPQLWFFLYPAMAVILALHLWSEWTVAA